MNKVKFYMKNSPNVTTESLFTAEELSDQLSNSFVQNGKYPKTITFDKDVVFVNDISRIEDV